ncbi:MAG TPA: helix-turn-helix domain-containing protein [candidate division Zixibacteria bacterium]|nr:helix-turn-helix domain-containing protein [candidate division Zixibacteria bacterium]
MAYKKHVGCPFTYALDIFGDKWSLIILRDLIIFGKRTYKDFAGSGEGIATNILADRLIKLEDDGMITKKVDKENKRSFVYSPTRKSLDLLPMFFELVRWSGKYDSITKVPGCYMNEPKETMKKLKKEIIERFGIELK